MKAAWVQALLGSYDDAEGYLKEALELQINAARTKQAFAAASRPVMHMQIDADLLFDDLTSDNLVGDDLEIPSS